MPTLPKQDRPAREGARVASVETGLAAAAAKLAQQVSVEKKRLFVVFVIISAIKVNSMGGKYIQFRKCFVSHVVFNVI